MGEIWREKYGLTKENILFLTTPSNSSWYRNDPFLEENRVMRRTSDGLGGVSEPADGVSSAWPLRSTQTRCPASWQEQDSTWTHHLSYAPVLCVPHRGSIFILTNFLAYVPNLFPFLRDCDFWIEFLSLFPSRPRIVISTCKPILLVPPCFPCGGVSSLWSPKVALLTSFPCRDIWGPW